MPNNDITKELHTNFIEYAYAVNQDRSIPDARDGLKPVAKRILWAATDTTKCVSNKPHVKSAKLVGDVMGVFHPHGDSSIYGALVRLSQDWIMRYPLIDFHGNNGTIIGDGPAHMRYTECRLSKLSEDGMLNGIKKEAVDFIPNYDETAIEPVCLPSSFPNLLCNPNSGIGVAMACSWAPHNLNEVAQAIYDYMDGKEPMLPGPDFPTGGIIINSNDIPSIMKSGHGSVKIRARYEIKKQNIIFIEIPYGTTVEDLLNEIGKVSDSKEVEGIEDVRDESNKNGLRIVVECEKEINPEIVVKKLFTKTNLQSSFNYNQVALVNKTPTELNLKDCIKIYINHNIECIKKETKFDLNKAQVRLEIVNGLLKALEDIDNIITLIKKSESASTAEDSLISKYNFTENQAKAILAMRLSSLAKLESIELNQEKSVLAKKISYLKDLIQNTELQKQIIKENLSSLTKKYGDKRKTELTQIDIKPEEKEIEAVVPEDVVVIISKTGDIKKIPKKSFRTQHRNGAGVKALDDVTLDTISTNTIDTLLVFTNMGKMYRLLVDKIPTGTNVSKGQWIGSLLQMKDNEKVSAITSLNREANPKYVIFTTKEGLIKKTELTEFLNGKRSTGIQAIKIRDNDELIGVSFVDNEDIVLITHNGMSIKFSTTDVNPTGRASSGVKGIKLSDGDYVIEDIIVKNKKYIAVFGENGCAKKTNITEYPKQTRGGKGVLTYKGKIEGAAALNDSDRVLLLGKTKSICIEADDIPVLGRLGMGNLMIKNDIATRVTVL